MIEVSVIIPMYNSISSIQNAISSVVEQTYRGAIEIIVINDGSSDGCEKIVEELIVNNQTNRVIRLLNKVNGGVSTARNHGIRKSQGKWVALLDSDDAWYPEKLALQMNAVSQFPEILFLGTNTNIHIYKPFKKQLKGIFFLGVKDILWQWHPQTSTMLIKKSLLEKIGLYNESRRYAEDGDMLLKCAQYTLIYVIDQVLVNYDNGKKGFGDSGLTSDLSCMYGGEILALKGAKRRGQITILEYYGFYLLMTLRFFRRVLIKLAFR